jgi:hypothetical protein
VWLSDEEWREIYTTAERLHDPSYSHDDVVVQIKLEDRSWALMQEINARNTGGTAGSHRSRADREASPRS